LLLQRQVFNAINPIIRLARLCDDLKIINARRYADFELVSVNNSRKSFSVALASRSFFQQIVVLGKEDTTQFTGPIQQ